MRRLSSPTEPQAQAADRRTGTVTVEFALIAPVLLLVLMGIIEFGLLFQDLMLLKNAAREGARLGAIGGSTTAITSRVENATQDLVTEDLTITQQFAVEESGELTWQSLGDLPGDVNNAPTGALLKIEVTYPHSLMATGLLPQLEDEPDSGTISLTTAATYRRE